MKYVTLGWDMNPTLLLDGGYVLPRNAEMIINAKYYPTKTIGEWLVDPETGVKLETEPIKKEEPMINLSKILSSPIIKIGGKLIDNVVLGGAIGNLKTETKEHPKGKMDWVTLVGSLVIPVGVLILLGLGVITFDQAVELKD